MAPEAAAESTPDGRPAPTPTEAAEELLVAYRTDADPEPYLSALAAFDDAALAEVRTDRATALAFWCNLYNAGTQHLLATRSGLYESRWRSLRFFSVPAVTVAGHALSLDDIEHGILRRRSKYGLGYLPRLVPDTFELRYRLADLDPRVHFALNCGAASCPAIRAYTPDAIDDQLDLATETYLDATVEYDPDADAVRVPRLFRWHPGDFGGRRGTREFLREYDAIPADSSPKVTYLEWDWSRAGDAFAGR
ncbi:MULTISPECIES: DUF547 domain-containing protein [Salinibaculum]|uniref:DUF547 domain-containing protein n=1 Tax=Salinibaculum TaxID=2732368 RepID=UPI0030D3BCC6